MVTKPAVTKPKAFTKPEYEFGGPIGAAGIVFGLPTLLYAFYFLCNDVSGCPAPALLSPSTLTWAKLKSQIPWPEEGLYGFLSWEASFWLGAYYLLSLILTPLLPATEATGGKLRLSGKSLKYRFNAFNATIFQLVLCAVGTAIYGANFPVWIFITDNYLELLTGNILLSFIISAWLYARSFALTPEQSHPSLRELAKGGYSGNFMYDYYIGRELNPRVTLPIFGEIDVKCWLEMRPGLTGWILMDLAFVAKQYRNYGFVSDSILFVTAVQSYYVLEGQYAESGILGMMDITTDGLGYMLTFGDIVWVPFLYSTMTRYLSIYPTQLGWLGLLAVSAVFATGVSIFRAANGQKYAFRTNPNHPQFKNATFLQTKRGTKLLTSGWWGVSRHINYFGDWLQATPFCLPTGIAGYVILEAGTGLGEVKMLDGREVAQGAARGWGMIFTYFYALYFAVLLIHREGRDDKACAEKYGDDWEVYKRKVRWKILPYVY